MSQDFQKTINEILYEKTKIAMEIFLKNKKNKENTFVIAGGVASNLSIRENLSTLSIKKSFNPIFPPINLCSDKSITLTLYWHSWVLVQGIHKKISKEIVRYGQAILGKN